MRTSPASLSAAPPPAARQADAQPADARPPNAQPPGAPGVSWPPPAGGLGVTGRELAERIAQFYAAHPAGRIVTELVTRAREAVVFRAAVYRGPGDVEPAATGWAASGWGLGPGFERAEEGAVGRALAHLGFAAAGELRGGRQVGASTAAPAGASPLADEPEPVDPARAALVADLDALVARAERYGLRARRAAAWRAWLRVARGAPDGASDAALRRAEQRLRAWVERRRAEPYGGAL